MSGPIRRALAPARARTIELLNKQVPDFDPTTNANLPILQQIELADQMSCQMIEDSERLTRAMELLIAKDQQWQNLIPTLPADKQDEEEATYGKAVEDKNGHYQLILYCQTKLGQFKNRISHIQSHKETLRQQMVTETLAAHPPIPAPQPAPALAPAAAPAAGLAQLKLPKMELPTFNGDPTHWSAFWDIWESSVHSSNLTGVQKLAYLTPKLTGDAANSIRGLPITNANYAVAIGILQKRFGDPTIIKTSLFARVRGMKISGTTVKDLRSTYDCMERNLRQLESLGEAVEQPILADILKSKLPAEVLVEMQRLKKPEDPWTVEFIRNGLFGVLSAKEEIQRVISPQAKEIPKSKGNNHGTKGDKSSETPQPATTTGSLTASVQGAPSSQSKNNRNRTPRQKQGGSQGSGQSSSPQGNQKKPTCVFCKGAHYNNQCTKYTSVADRKKCIQAQRDPVICLRCLRKGHMIRECTNRVRCYHCKSEKHHSALCTQQASQPTGTSSVITQQSGEEADNQPSTSQQTTLQVTSVPISSALSSGSRRAHHLNSVKTSMLLTASSMVSNPSNVQRAKKVQVFFDPGAQRTFIKQSLVDQLQLHSDVVQDLLIYTFGSSQPQRKTAHHVAVNILLRDGSSFTVQADALQQLTSAQQRQPLDSKDQNFIRDSIPAAFFADDLPTTVLPFNPDIIIGEDYFWDFLIDTPRTQLPSGLYLIPSKLGLLIGGKQIISSSTSSNSNQVLHVQCLMNQALEEVSFFDPPPLSVANPNLEDFWQLERIGITDSPTINEDDDAVDQFNKSIEFHEGRYFVKWPLNDKIADLPSNKGLSLRRFKSLNKRFQQEPELLPKYAHIIQEQCRLGIIEPVNHDIADGRQFHYLPHHPVVTPEKATTKVRIVYDGSARTKFTQSINDCLLRGQVILPDLCGLLLRFRLQPIAIIADIEKAFLQVGLQDADRDLTRFWWYKDATIADASDSNLQIYRFCRVPFGIISSPFLLAATVKHHLQQYENEVAELILSNIYVDNVIIGTHSVETALNIYNDSKMMFQEASMNLREWASNCSPFIQSLPKEDRVEPTTIKVLGLSWDTQRDMLIMSQPKLKPIDTLTKRKVSQIVSSIFDPLGFLSPSTLNGKLFLQQLWEQQLDWDDPIPSQLRDKFHQILQDLQDSNSLELKRFVDFDSSKPVEIHVFIDASSKAYALAAYLRQSTGPHHRVNLIFAKVRLTPKQPKITIPRLELLAMLIGCRALQFLHTQLQIHISASFVWSDSQCCLQWLTTKRPLARFVQNRITEIHNIQHSIPSLSFHFVKTQDNPADMATRGLTISELKDFQMWWTGPPWLATDQWPQHHFPPVTDTVLKLMEEELCKTKTIPLYSAATTVQLEDQNPLGIDITKFSSLSKLYRVTAQCLRFLKKCGKFSSGFFTSISISGPLIYNDLKSATSYWDLHIQQHYFADIIESMNNNTEMPIVKQLGLQFNPDGIITCHGRFQTCNIFQGQFPVLVPKKSHYTQLLILDRHNQVHHSGVQHTLSALRKTHWLPAGRFMVRNILKTCRVCRKVQGGPYALPRMAPYPPTRTTRACPFQFTGVDYLGPLWYKDNDGNRCKAYICLFTCLVTRAVHLELVVDMTAQMFLNCLRRFIARRGTPERVLSDNAPTFMLAKAAIQQKWNDLTQDEQVVNYCSSNGINWKTTTPLAPWQGGIYERLVGLTKSAFKKAIGHKLLSLEQLQTFVPEIESILNTRPLTYVYSDSNQVLRPVDFLVPHGSLGTPPSTEDPNDPTWVPKLTSSDKLIKFWNNTQQSLDQFWAFWHEEYLKSLLEHTQLDHKQPLHKIPFSPKPDDVVLIKEENMPRGSWKMGKIHQLHLSDDGLQRSADILLPTQQVLTRPINLLYPIEFSANSSFPVPSSNDHRVKQSPFRLPNFGIIDTHLCVLLTLIICSFLPVSGWTSNIQLQLCSRGRSGHAIEVPTTFACHLPKNHPIEKTMVELWTQRDQPQRTRGYHCYIQVHSIMTHTSFVGGKAVVGDITQHSSVLPSDCWEAVQMKTWPQLHIPLVELSPGFWSSNLSLHVEYRWCCYDHENSITNFFLEQGEIASIDGQRLVSDLQDLSACNPQNGHCQNRDMGVTVWNGSKFIGQCSFQNNGHFVAVVSGQSIIIQQLQGAFSYSGKAHVPGSDCVPKTAMYTDQGAVYIQFLNQTPAAWLELTHQAMAPENENASHTSDQYIDLSNYKRFFLYKKLLQIETREFGLIWHQLCAIKQTQLNHVWQLLRIDPSLGIRALLGRNDLHAEWAGQALIFWECRNITPAVIHYSGQYNSTCYKYTPVQLEKNGALFFISPGSRDLVRSSPILDCSHSPPHYFKDSTGQWHSSSGPIHVTKIPLEMSWKGLWKTFTFKAPSLFTNKLGHFSNFLDFQHQIHRMTLVEKTLDRLVDYTSSMSLDPGVIKNSIAGIGEGMAHLVEGNAKALGHLITGVTHGIGDLASTLLKGPLQLFLNIVIIIIIFCCCSFAIYLLIKFGLIRRKSFSSCWKQRPQDNTQASTERDKVVIEMKELQPNLERDSYPALPVLLYEE